LKAILKTEGSAKPGLPDSRRGCNRKMSSNQIVRLLEEKGPLTGAEVVASTRREVFDLWRECRNLAEIHVEVVGTRFLRLDRAVRGYARLSPSIRREFLTYTLLGLKSRQEAFQAAAGILRGNIAEISAAKLALARDSMASAVEALEERDLILDKACFLIAGDVVYHMSHMVPRPEKSTGEMVRGSDLDIIVIVNDDLPESLFSGLDRAIYRKKHFLLVHPNFREEIDYIIKNIARVKEQLRFDTFESMVACKILREGRFLYGSSSLFGEVKDLLEESDVAQRLDEMERQAVQGRHAAEELLLGLPADAVDSESIHLFYTREEGEEIY
jgi:hypothetical protein